MEVRVRVSIIKHYIYILRVKKPNTFGNIYKLNELIKEERLSALKKFQHSSTVGEYPSEKEIAKIEDNEFESFQKKLNS